MVLLLIKLILSNIDIMKTKTKLIKLYFFVFQISSLDTPVKLTMDKSSQKKRKGGAEKEQDIFKIDPKPCSQLEKLEGETSSSESPIINKVEYVTPATGTSEISTTDPCQEAPLTEVDVPTASSVSISSLTQPFQ